MGETAPELTLGPVHLATSLYYHLYIHLFNRGLPTYLVGALHTPCCQGTEIKDTIPSLKNSFQRSMGPNKQMITVWYAVAMQTGKANEHLQ